METKNISLKNTDKVQKSVTSSMIWGSQWDATLNWFLKGTNEEKSYVTNSKGWYSGVSGNDEHKTGVDLNKDGKIVNRVKNIYDMAGNVFDWTLEILSFYGGRVYRGGGIRKPYASGSDDPASDRGTDTPDTYEAGNGSRSTLILNL